ncbi:unnamed protein product [Chrysodeixis includens]|uniref:LRRNT domain-containing protein n=1 Tax=Chrysodeixis includens TaxID=689277 RepID=A0A9P0BSR1_CHRIL|nr:unnamed protein product [Chrysodeixis includens]
MTLKHLFILVLALSASALAQSDDELHIPVENDNQFPPDNHAELDGNVIEGSGTGGVIEEPLDTVTDLSTPFLEDVQLTGLTDNIPTVAAEEKLSCPQPCVCNIEGDTKKYIVDCSGYELTELPKPLDEKTTELNLQNNKLTEIPKALSTLKNLKVLNVNNNEIMEIVRGSISELPELTTLKLGNNRLIEYPQDLKTSFGLTKLEELDLGGNDMRTELKPEVFSNFIALRSLTLPTAPAGLANDLCSSLKQSLTTVCVGSCNAKAIECPDAPQDIESDMLDFALPGLIALGSAPEENSDPALNSETPDNTKSDGKINETPLETNVEGAEATTLQSSSDGGFSFRSAKVANEESKGSQPAEESDSITKPKSENEIVGATTSEKKTGGVDKSVIGMVVAGMVLVVAGITIKKNWSSIRNRLSSTPRNANERAAVNTNGTAPEEVPLQEKSPV